MKRLIRFEFHRNYSLVVERYRAHTHTRSMADWYGDEAIQSRTVDLKRNEIITDS